MPQEISNNASITTVKKALIPSNAGTNSTLAFFIVGILLDAQQPGLTVTQIHRIVSDWGYHYSRRAVSNALHAFPQQFSNLRLTAQIVHAGYSRAKAYTIQFVK